MNNIKEKRLKILFLPAWYPSREKPINGVFVREHAKAVTLYNDVVVLYDEGRDRKIKSLYKIISDKNEDGIRTVRIKHRKSLIPKTTYFIYLWSIFSVFRKLLREGWRPDIIHSHIFTAGVPAVILGKIYKIPVVITEHWTGFPLHRLGKLAILETRFAMNRAKIIIPVSRSLEEAIKFYGITNNFRIVPNVVNIEMFHPTLNRNKGGKKRILLVALLSPQKGISYLLHALAQLKEKRQDFVLDIVGDGPNRREYEEITRRLGLGDIVKFYGLKTKEEVAKFMRRSDFFILSSIWENLPCVLIEAMASGLPIITTEVGGIPEIVNKEIGILVSPKDMNALSVSVNYMLDNYQNYSPKKISQYAKENFSYEAVGKRLDGIYREIIYEKENE